MRSVVSVFSFTCSCTEQFYESRCIMRARVYGGYIRYRAPLCDCFGGVLEQQCCCFVVGFVGSIHRVPPVATIGHDWFWNMPLTQKPNRRRPTPTRCPLLSVGCRSV